MYFLCTICKETFDVATDNDTCPKCGAQLEIVEETSDDFDCDGYPDECIDCNDCTGLYR